eukprot:CAMPEP_0181433612 /NCGR_PEP_ID=MMETSP1110-20121109/19385_1 /TAXON_ID=174948 /ORGANISM="Symbiodinium sp., Strain CCMP421" /LENGTH=64 /DNA_ID=CAMNT_0023557077 /DNA_START=58 /DNA_END=249 /DNA_ORIENTATION=+
MVSKRTASAAAVAGLGGLAFVATPGSVNRYAPEMSSTASAKASAEMGSSTFTVGAAAATAAGAV